MCCVSFQRFRSEMYEPCPEKHTISYLIQLQRQQKVPQLVRRKTGTSKLL